MKPDLDSTNVQVITSRLAEQTGDVSNALKLLGFLVFVANEGSEPFQSGEYISLQTYHRWVEQIRAAGLGDMLLDVRLRQVLSEFVQSRFAGLEADDTREKLLGAVERSFERLNF